MKNIYYYLGLEPPAYLNTPLTSAIAKPSRYPKGEITPSISGIATSDDSWLNAGCIDIPDGPLLSESKFFDKICFGYDKNNFYLRFYINDYIQNNPEITDKTFQIYIYMRNADRKQSLSPVRLISKTESILPISKEKFHNELQITTTKENVKLVRLIKSIPNNLWVLQPVKDIKCRYQNVIDMSVPFDLIDISMDEALEFCFVDGNYGIKNFFIPNDMLLTIKRE